ncbi:hypothetical protein ACWKSP_15120 [Micromonosporaceae bacterium Da 78-11]
MPVDVPVVVGRAVAVLPVEAAGWAVVVGLQAAAPAVSRRAATATAALVTVTFLQTADLAES